MWYFKNKPFTNPDGHFGFVYLITCLIDQRKYIGKKQFYCYRTIKKKKVWKESNWKDYYSSSNEVKQLVKEFGKDAFKREIVSLHKTRIDLTYSEASLQFHLNVLENRDFMNGNILNKFFTKNIRNSERTIDEQLILSIVNKL
jgi:hypothetical protein